MKTDWLTKALLVFVGSGLWALALMHGASRVNAQAPSVPGVIKAQKFIVVDANGKTVAALGSLKEGTMNGTGLALYDTQGVRRVGVGVLSDGTSGLALSDAQGNRRVALGVDSNGNPGIIVTDATGNTIYQKP